MKTFKHCKQVKGYRFKDLLTKVTKDGSSSSMHCGQALINPCKMVNGEYFNCTRADATSVFIEFQFSSVTYVVTP